jgi:hypothetical protein
MLQSSGHYRTGSQVFGMKDAAPLGGRCDRCSPNRIVLSISLACDTTTEFHVITCVGNEHAKNNTWLRVQERVPGLVSLAADLHAPLGQPCEYVTPDSQRALPPVRGEDARASRSGTTRHRPQMAAHGSAVAVERVANLAGGGQATGKQ